ncbi:MAG TPA: type II secretion system protein [Opitutaceae bacterium]|nr:type II secretion system protein [Opitutaceae bacterium]
MRQRCSTTSETLGAARRLPLRDGFTLLEVLLTLAIIGLVASVLVVGSVKLTEARSATPEDVFWKALAEARKRALLSGQEERLRFIKEKKEAAFSAQGPNSDERFPIEDAAELTVDFLSTQKSSSAILLRGQLVETQTIPYVTFYGDGTCTPFRVQFRSGGTPRVIAIDPWTCARILENGEGKQ